MKILKTGLAVKTFSLILAVLMVLSGCKAPDNNDGNKNEEKSKLNGVPISEYAIVYSNQDYDYSMRAAQYIKKEIQSRTGVSLKLVEETEKSDAKHEIVVGETSREISCNLNADTQYLQFAIMADDESIALEGDRFVIAAAAYFFIETYVPEDDYSAEIPKDVRVHEPIVRKADNYILLIGDGMGENHTKLFDMLTNNAFYSDSENFFYGYSFPYQGKVRTNSLSGTTDSAAAATALATGFKTKNSHVGVDKDLNPLKSLTEFAGALGKATAVMSTEASSGATPGGFSAHVADRGMTDEIIEHQNALKRQYGTVISCKYDYYDESGIAIIEENIEKTLKQLSNKENGFFIMYEEAHIDKHSHVNDIEKTFLAVIRFNQAIARFMEYAFYNPNTLVIITADHETGKLLSNGNLGFAYNSEGHSNQDVPVFAYGKGAEVFNEVVIENIQIPQTIASLMGVKDFGDQSTYKPLF